MKLQTMFQKDINRDINGVIKVAQDDTASLRQELEEYIITRELRRHFRTFFDHYTDAIRQPTDKIGVWISGFFGSGKSHFLKMLSYLLTNREVAGKKALEYFADKFDDPTMYADAVKCTTVPTESILFNIDIEGPVNKDKTAVLRVFAKVFYDHCGFYGDDLKVARLERFVEKQGKTAAFQAAFQEVNGETWEESRSAFAFFEDDIVEVLQSVLGMSEQAARNWFNGEETNELSISQLVDDIEAYVEGRGKDFRLLFMVDEVGQYIGDDGSLMINLQSIVEELGSRCRGKVWVMVTSQEAIDSVVKIAGDDFSKIQGRFNTRLSLSSSSVDEVIKKRVLAKTQEADQLLRMVYDKEQAALKNLFTFTDTVMDIKGFPGGEEFAASFPFVPYQFIIIQKVLAEIRKHGNSGKHLSGGERSMLSGFQEAAQKLQERDEHALAPFPLFYDTVHTFLESAIRRVIDRCQTAADNGDGLEQQDVSVLKLLYLVRYITDIKANIDNIAILMIDDIATDKIALRTAVSQSLERLLRQNYISRSGDTYAFLTDEEQEIAEDIRKTPVDSAQIVQSIAQTIYGEIYPSKKFKYGRYDFAYDQYIDETLYGSASGGIRLRILTEASDLYEASEAQLVMESQRNNEAILVLSGETPYFDDLMQAARINKFVKTKNISQQSESIQEIIRRRQQEARTLILRARGYLESAIAGARVVVCGEVLNLRTSAAKDKLDTAMKNLVESVYSKLGMVTRFAESDADILAILNGSGEEPSFTGLGANNEEALRELSQWLEVQSSRGFTTTMEEVQKRCRSIPYGWREIDIAALVARLAAGQKITVLYAKAPVALTDRKFPDYLRKKSLIGSVTITRRIAPTEKQLRESRDFLRELLGVMDVPRDENGLIRFVTETFEERQEHYRQLLAEYDKGRYPQREVLKAALEMAESVLSQRRDNVALMTRMLQQRDDLLDSGEDMEDIETFFRTQRPVFDNAGQELERISRERDYFEGDADALGALREMASILGMEKPYGRIGELPELTARVKASYGKLMEAKLLEVAENIRQCLEEIHLAEKGTPLEGKEIMRQAENQYRQKQAAAESADTLTQLDAIIAQAQNLRRVTCNRLLALVEPAVPPQKPDRLEKPAAPAVVRMSRRELCGPRQLKSREEIDRYVEEIREKLRRALEKSGAVVVSD